MSTSWSNEETFKLIDLYQSEPAIWDSNHALHKDKNEVNDAWDRIAVSLQIPVPELKKKKETLMSAFRLHFKRKQDSIRSGVGEEEIYKPIWIYYDAMEAFLKEKYTCKRKIPSHEQRASRHWRTRRTSDARSSTETKDTKFKIRKVQRKRTIKPPELDSPENDTLNAYSTLDQSMLNRDQNRIEDDCELYGRLLASKLRKYSENERQEIMYDIDGLLLRRRRDCSPQYLSSPSEIILKEYSSPASNHSYPSPQSP